MAIVAASICVAIGTLWSLVLLVLWLSDSLRDSAAGAILFVPPMFGVVVPHIGWLLVAIKTRAARSG